MELRKVVVVGEKYSLLQENGKPGHAVADPESVFPVGESEKIVFAVALYVLQGFVVEEFVFRNRLESIKKTN